MEIVVALAQTPRELPELQKLVKLSDSELSTVIDPLIEANVIEVRGKRGRELVDLSNATKEALKAYLQAPGA